jgi:hypothetical protein
MSTSLQLYRDLVPAHAAVDEAVVLRWLGVAARRHSPGFFGDLFAEAMVWWAASAIESMPGTGIGSDEASGAQGPLTSQRDGDLARTWAAPARSTITSSNSGDEDLLATVYGRLFLNIRDTRAGNLPDVVSVGPGCW